MSIAHSIFLSLPLQTIVPSQASPDQLRVVFEGSQLMETSNAIGTTTVSASERCGVCEEHWEAEQEIARSPNPNCRHIFHRLCILSTLAESSDCQCPQCHRVYVNDTGEY